jgi:hypothetical protein
MQSYMLDASMLYTFPRDTGTATQRYFQYSLFLILHTFISLLSFIVVP